MTRKTHLIVPGAAAAGILIAALTVVPAGGQGVRVKRVPAEIRTIAPDVFKRLTTASSREVVLQSIKGLPQAPAPAPAAQQPGPAPVLKRMLMPGGPGKPKAAAAAVAGAVRNAVMSTGYDKIDWKAGVFISPFAPIPTYGNGNWPVAAMNVRDINSLSTYRPGIVYLGWPPQSGTGYYTIYTAVDVRVELPETPGLYTLTLKIARPDGTCPESWFQNRPGGGYPPLTVHFGDGYAIPMTKLIDDSGFVGIVNLQPGPLYDGSSYGMRAYNAWIDVQAIPWSAKPEEGDARLNPLVFGGIVITLLQ